MAEKVGSLFASLDLESAAFVNGLRDATRATNRAADSIDKGLSRASTAVKGFIAVWAANNAIQGARKLMELADAGKRLEGQLRLATKEFGTYGQAQRDVNRIAAETRVSVNETGILYAKNARGVRELGGSQAEAALMTENFNKALKVGNAGTQEIASATLAWGQAMNSGKMEGEDFNSIIDASPPLIEALARAMGVPIGAMKKLVEEGKVTSRVMVDALTKPQYTKKLVEDFQDVPRTWEESVTLIENQAQALVGAFDRGSGLSNAIVDLFQRGVDGATDMDRAAEDAGIRTRGEFVATAATIRGAFEELDTAFEPLRSAAIAVFGDINQQALSSRDYIVSVFKTIDDLRNAPANAALWVGDRIKANTGITVPRTWLVPDSYKPSDIAGNWGRNYDRDVETRRGEAAVRRMQDNTPATARFKPSEARDWLNQRGRFDPKLRNRKPPAPPTNKSDSKPRGRSSEQIAREEQRAADAARRDMLAFQNDLGRAQDELIRAKLETTNVAQARYEFERAQLDLEYDERARGLREQGPQGSKRFTQAQVDQLAELDRQAKELRLEGINQRERQQIAEENNRVAAASLQNAIDLQASGADLARSAKDRRAAELRILDLHYQQERLGLDAIVASETATQAEKDIAKARLAILDTLRGNEQRQIERRTAGPWEAHLDAIPRTREEIRENIEAVAVDGLDSLKSGLADTIKGVGSLGDAFGKMADRVIDGLLDIALQQMLIKPLGSLLFGGEGGGGLFGGLIKGLASGIQGGAPTLGGKASGGLGNRGRWLVGEHGPELIEMPGPFNVASNSKLRGVQGAGGNSVAVTFGAITSNDPAAVKAMAMEAIVQMAPMLTQNAKNATIAELRRPKM